MLGAQRRQEEREGFKFIHCWNMSPRLASEYKTPSELILASDRSELTYGTPDQTAPSPAVRHELSAAGSLALKTGL